MRIETRELSLATMAEQMDQIMKSGDDLPEIRNARDILYNMVGPGGKVTAEGMRSVIDQLQRVMRSGRGKSGDTYCGRGLGYTHKALG